MANYTLRRESLIDQPTSVVFDFFSKAENLERITPPWLRFRILTPPPIEMRRGATIPCQLRVRAGSCIGRFPDPFRTPQSADLVTGPNAVEAVDFTPSAKQLSQEYFLAAAAAVSVRTENAIASTSARAASLTFMLSFQVEFDEPD